MSRSKSARIPSPPLSFSAPSAGSEFARLEFVVREHEHAHVEHGFAIVAHAGERKDGGRLRSF
jgi:hypothetical protein